MHRLIGAALLACALGRASIALAQEAMVGVDAGGDSFLYGSLLKPATTDPVPFVLIVPAAAPTDRNGNDIAPGATPNTYKLLAEALAVRGVGSLRIDPRGVGGSVSALGAEADLRLDTFVADTVTWAKFLQLQPGVKCVVILGHAEGALIGALAAQQVKTCGVIEMAAVSRPAGDLIAQQLKAAEDGGKMSEELYSQATHILAELRANRPVADVPLSLSSLFRPSLQPYLMSWLNQDPIAAEKGLSPLMVIQGDNDLQVPPEDGRRLANVSRAIRLVVLPGVNHVLKVAPADRDGNLATYKNPELALAPDLAPVIVNFIEHPPQIILKAR
jgi:pimeloyl-ACP methyl ester carboxylesterase